MNQHAERSFRPRRLLRVALLAIAGTQSLYVSAQEGTTVAPEGPQRVALSAGQAHALELLLDVRPEHPAPLFLLTDPNKDPDDLTVLVLASYLQRHGFVDLRCVVTTLGDRETRLKRARFARTVLDQLGLGSAKVGAGVDYAFEVQDASGGLDVEATEGRRKDHQVFIETPLADPQAVAVTDGLGLLETELGRVPDRSAVLLINAGMGDAAALLRDASELVRQKTAKVVIMGGVEPHVDERGFVIADKRAYNNKTHQPSADFTYLRVQELGLPLVVIAKEAAYAAAVPRDFYEGIAATRHPIGVYLRDQQKQSLEHLWEGIQQGQLPQALTSAWFFDTFTDLDIDTPAGQTAIASAERNPDDFGGIWSQVSKLNLYDPLALLAAVPGAADRLFRRQVPAGSRGEVAVVGEDAVTEPVLVKDLLSALAVQSLDP